MTADSTRTATIERKTGESDISITVNLDGSGRSEIDTPNGFMNHMLDALARHGSLDLSVRASGDTASGPHHIAEDTAIVLGRCIDKALGERRGIVRMGHAFVPLDEALTMCVIDLSGRGYPVVDLASNNNIGEFPTDLARHFFESASIEGRFNIHLRVMAGTNEHHVIESAFKAFGRALRDAVKLDERNPDTIPSTKGAL
ncbi:MAG: imidazoleglycerol-phosphate dehydratase HisB [Chloroflexi bacterium]|nr:imidazoleglycerol-phosphate dehydratase HisB [Chloroflexota bacterium]MCH7642528.1 imidazoleglycerol-phosphate dehydratase HisB [Chloroflexota bacterium]